ncbi:hypothetical protein [Kutzneria sp. NPDC051319]|uniref:hypothetical protein n=1 Tax=Kutzneria sp. NPDC051319 TaxID=3155047 RepID=UPI003434B5C7
MWNWYLEQLSETGLDGEIEPRLAFEVGLGCWRGEKQHRFWQLEQRVRPRGQAVMEFLPEPGQLLDRSRAVGILRTDHRNPWCRLSFCRKTNDQPRAALMISRQRRRFGESD